MKIKIIAVGKLKERYWRESCEEYIKRLISYSSVDVVEIKEYRLQGDGRAAENKVKEEEGKSILSRISDDSYVIALDVNGTGLSSEKFSDKIKTLSDNGKGEIAFIIGGSLGLSSEVISRADFRLSFSDMTFPHQMMRVILLEQIYRAFKIMRGETYHK